MTVSIDPVPSDPGLDVVDRVEQRRCRIGTDVPVDPSTRPAERVGYPVDVAAAVEVGSLSVSRVNMAYVRDATGQIVGEIRPFSTHRTEPGEHVLEVSAPVKLYLRVEGPVSVALDAGDLTVDLDRAGSVLVGLRSYHQRPAATVTTTTRPRDLMRAVSLLSSSLKTTSPERSYPTLRGHPPEVVLGSDLDVPDGLAPADSGVVIEVPPDVGSVFVAAPLSYYLGAAVVPGTRPRLVADDGWSTGLDGPGGFERTVERVLKRVFFLDCLVRTEGIYDVPLHERRAVEDDLDLDLAGLYDAATAARLRAYLEVSRERLAPLVPRWKLTAHVAPRAESVEVLPFLVDDLAVVRTPEPDRAPTTSPSVDRRSTDDLSAAIDAFTGDGFTGDGSVGDSWGGEDSSESPTSVVEPARTDSLEQAWVGDGVPVGASKATVEAFRNRLARDETTGEVSAVVVCNDPEMVDEHRVASEVYGTRDDRPFDVTLYEELTTDRLALVLGSDIDFLHYIGHIDAAGFRCHDGVLDATDLADVAVDTFFLNACSSYEQGMALIENGAIGGVVTRDEVVDAGAVRVGTAMIRLLNRGFPLRAALTIASDSSVVGPQYTVVGDGNADVVHAETLVPNLVDVTEVADGRVSFDFRTYYTGAIGVGSLTRPYVGGNEEHYLVGSRLAQFDVDEATFREFLSLEVTLVRRDGRVYWSDETELSELR